MNGGGSVPQVKETEAEKALADVAASKWQDYQDNYVPLENSYIDSVENLNSAGSKARVAADAQSNIQSNVGGLLSQHTKNNMQKGLDPTSGATKTGGFALQLASQQSKAAAGDEAKFGAENSYLQGIGSVVAMGEGQEASAFDSMGSIADRAAGTSINNAKNDFTKFQSNQDVNGAVIGGLAAYGMNKYAKPPGVNGNTTGKQNDIGFGYWDPSKKQWINPRG